MNKNDRVYLDWAAASPLLPEAKTAMLPWLTDEWGNPSAIHAEGQAARTAVETARAQIARSLEARSEQVFFTGSGTESNTIAILGAIEAKRAAGVAYADMQVISTRIEHPSVVRTLEALEARGVSVYFCPVKESGVVDLAALQELLTDKTVLVTLALVNSEVGTIQPSRAIAKLVKTSAPKAVVHLDAAQAPLWLSCQFSSLGADVVTFDAGKCRGPKGVGMLVKGKSVELVPSTYGGGQEAGLRPGTENVAGIVGGAAAFVWAQDTWRERAEQVAAVRDQAVEYLLQEIQQAVLNGALLDSGNRVANNINISLIQSSGSFDTEYATVVLDAAGFAVSTKSACSGAGGGESAVVKELTGDPARATSTLRITLGPDTTLEQLKSLTSVIKKHVEQMKQY